ncbi:MAG: hypothetical protein Q9174_005869 [Haloplaca sp. 1 TL-2023]
MSSRGNRSSSPNSRQILEPRDDEPRKSEVLESVLGSNYLRGFQEGQDGPGEDVRGLGIPQHKEHFQVAAEEAITPDKLIKLLEEGSKIMRDHIKLLENHTRLRRKHTEVQCVVQNLTGQLDDKDSLILTLKQQIADQDSQIQQSKEDRSDTHYTSSEKATPMGCSYPPLHLPAYDQHAPSQHPTAPSQSQQTFPLPTAQVQNARARPLATSPPLSMNTTRSGRVQKRKDDQSQVRGKTRGGRLQAGGRAEHGMTLILGGDSMRGVMTEGGNKVEKGEDELVIKKETT